MERVTAFACYSVDSAVRMNSSSGAFFSTVAEYVILKQGMVYGVAMSEDCLSANFVAIRDRDELAQLRGSKYLQATVGETFKKIKADLFCGKLVLFTGTGCQVNGLKNFLGEEYENLICIDVICHGVPSPKLWKKCVQYQEMIYAGKLKAINFRCKDKRWADFDMKEVIKEKTATSKKIYISKNDAAYMQMFLKNYCLRPSCYNCSAKKVKMADISIADFWGIDNVAPEMNDGKGTSLVLVRTNKGMGIFEMIQKSLKSKVVSYEEAIKGNSAEYKSCDRPCQREFFYDDVNNMDFETLKKKYVVPDTFKSKLKIKKAVNKALRIIGGGGQSVKQINDYSLCFVFDCGEKV